MTDKKLDYGQSENGNFKVIDTIGVPHSFCITPQHVAYAADHFGGMLSKNAIEASGAPCGVRGCQLQYSAHEQALLVSCLSHMTSTDEENMGKNKANPELHKYLLDIKEQAEKENYAGFAFLDSRGNEKHPDYSKK